MDIAVRETREGNEGCPVCGGGRADAAKLTSAGDRDVLACNACGFVFVWPRIEQDFSNVPEEAYYANWELLDLDSIAGLYAEVDGAARRAGLRVAGSTLSILDVGCGAGHTLPHFRAHGWAVRGVDPWRAVTAAGRKYYRVPLETARIEAVAIPPGSQHVVLSIDVLQYVADPRAFLDACFAALVPRGLLFLTVPNYGGAARTRDGWSWAYFLPGSYLSYFTAETLSRLVRSAGFTTVATSGFGGPEGDDFLQLTAVRPEIVTLTWGELGGEVEDHDLPPLDRRDVDEARLASDQRHWREHGYVIVPGLMPAGLIERYCAVFRRLGSMSGWASGSPYLDVAEIRDLCLYKPLADLLEHLIGEPMGLHLNLTGWLSTERNWHQDDYLNPPDVNSHYAAVWIALDRISPDSGPFEFVPASHRWPFVRQSKVLALLGREDGHDPSWPWDSERLLTPFFEREIRERGLEVQRFLGNAGDVLVWHSRLLHRGSAPERPGTERRALIAHYSAVSRRRDMPVARRHPGGGLFFDLRAAAPVAVPTPEGRA